MVCWYVSLICRGFAKYPGHINRVVHTLQGLAGGSYAQQWTCDAAESGLSLDSEVWGIKKKLIWTINHFFFSSLPRHILLYLLGLLSRCGSLCVGENYGCLHDFEPSRARVRVCASARGSKHAYGRAITQGVSVRLY